MLHEKLILVFGHLHFETLVPPDVIHFLLQPVVLHRTIFVEAGVIAQLLLLDNGGLV